MAHLSMQQIVGGSTLRRLAHLCLCAAYIQGGINKVLDFPAAVAEMSYFGLSPAAPFAVAVIALELGGSAAILFGIYRWIAALALAAFTLLATGLADQFWLLEPPHSTDVASRFFEHLGLIGGFLLVAWGDFNGISKDALR